MVLAPLPDGYGAIPGVTEDTATLSAATSSADVQVLLIAPDAATVPIYDPARRGPAAVAGQAPGTRLAAVVAELWRQV